MCQHFLSLDNCQVCGPRPEDVGTIAHLNETGDSKYTWNRKKPRECEAAHEHFETMRKKGFLVFKVKPFGRKSKQPVGDFDPKDGGYVYAEPKDSSNAELATKFDPKANYIATPPVRGG